MQVDYKFKLEKTFGTINVAPNDAGMAISVNPRYAFVPSLQNLSLWNLLTGNLETVFCDTELESPITKVHMFEDPSKDKILLGYQKGEILVVAFDQDERSFTVKNRLSGHKRAVTAFASNAFGSDPGSTEKQLVASGSRDTDIIVWDVFEGVGVRKLRGHTNEITGLEMLNQKLFSSSKDSLVKIWDLESFCCLHSLHGHSSEVWSLKVDPLAKNLLTGSTDGKVRVWDISFLDEEQNLETAPKYIGSLPTEGSRRQFQILISTRHIFVVSSNRIIDAFLRFSNEESTKAFQRRLKRAGKKTARTKINSGSNVDRLIEDDEFEGNLVDSDKMKKIDNKNIEVKKLDKTKIAVDYYRKSFTLATKLKVTSALLWEGPKSKQKKLLLGLSNNTFQIFTISRKKVEGAKFSMEITTQGHRTPPKSVQVSGGSAPVVMTASSREIKLWGLKDAKCFRTVSVPTQDLVIGDFVHSASKPEPDCLIAATKGGQILAFEIATGELLFRKTAHDGSVNALIVVAGQKSRECNVCERIVTGGSDGKVVFWKFLEANRGFDLFKEHVLDAEEAVNAIVLGKDNKHVVVGLLDSKLKIFYQDTFKFHLSLFGHKLPVTCCDLSDDGTLVVSGSADKNVRVWGTRFGDCQISLFAHDAEITCVKFLKDSHNFFSAGKDKLIKLWNADTHEQMLVLRGHCAEVMALAFNTSQTLMVSVSNDMSVRFWRKTDEQLFPAEEKELELERDFEIQEQMENDKVKGPGQIPGSGIEEPSPLARVVRSSKNSRLATEAIFEALDEVIKTLAKDEIEFVTDFLSISNPKQLENFKILKNSSKEIIAPLLFRIPLGDLEPALQPVDSISAIKLLLCIRTLLPHNIEESSPFRSPPYLGFERIARCVLLLAKQFEGEFSDNESAREALRQLGVILKRKAGEWRKTVSQSLVKVSFLLKKKRQRSQSNVDDLWEERVQDVEGVSFK